ncbi:MAG: Xaa-Pro dipeptidase [Myxococcales bacterium]|nr:Xaa-Pro dipeptidase [Myxococcales bacterium]
MSVSLAQLYREHLAHILPAYAKALEASGFDALVVESGEALQKNPFDDQYFAFAATPTFLHFAPICEAGAYLVLRHGQPPTIVRTAGDDFWDAPATPDRDFWHEFVVVNATQATLADHLPANKPTTALIHSRRGGDQTTPAALAGVSKNPQALIAAIHAIRTRKTPYELACMRVASERAVRGHIAARALFDADTNASELALHLAYLAASEQDDAQTPYKGIVALGEHAATLHYVNYKTTGASTAPSFLIDAGAAYCGYASDITRTYVRGGSLFSELLEGMETLQQALVRGVRPGRAYEDLHDDSHVQLATLLADLDIAGGSRGSREALVSRGVTRAFFPHGLGHSLGLQVHDVGCKLTPPRAENPYLRNTSVIESGQVFTIEPGFYVIPALLAPLRADDRAGLVNWGAVDALAPFGGIRIEDNIAVHADRIENLTRDAFRMVAG